MVELIVIHIHAQGDPGSDIGFYGASYYGDSGPHHQVSLVSVTPKQWFQLDHLVLGMFRLVD